MAHLPLKDPVSWLYPPIEPCPRTGRLEVSDLHELYLEESGNPGGKPVIFLHGGPGGGTEPNIPATSIPEVAHRPVRPAGLREKQPPCRPETEHHLGPGGGHRGLREYLGIQRWGSSAAAGAPP